jgi:3-oxoacyl-[acyl-carrier-protein] synthase-1
MSPSIALLRTALVSAVGLNGRASCAAIRARLANPTDTDFVDANGQRIVGHAVPLDKPWRGRRRLAAMAAMVIEECTDHLSEEERARVPVLLCLAESQRPGRLDGLDDQLAADVAKLIGAEFPDGSAVIARGRVSAAVALLQAGRLLEQPTIPQVLIAGADSLLRWPTLSAYDQEGRLLSARNANGFMPGEAAGAVLVGRATGPGHLTCTGLGFAVEAAHIGAAAPLRGDGLTSAIRQALDRAQCELHDLDFRITDTAGEHYYFKEGALAMARILRQRKEHFDIWHPAECIGESGSVAGLAALAVAHTGWQKGYAPSGHVLVHLGNDAGERAAAVIREVSR